MGQNRPSTQLSLPWRRIVHFHSSTGWGRSVGSLAGLVIITTFSHPLLAAKTPTLQGHAEGREGSVTRPASGEARIDDDDGEGGGGQSCVALRSPRSDMRPSKRQQQQLISGTQPDRQLLRVPSVASLGNRLVGSCPVGADPVPREILVETRENSSPGNGRKGEETRRPSTCTYRAPGSPSIGR